MIYAEKNSVTCFIGTEKVELKQGCGMFINSGVLHRFLAEQSNFMPNIVFSPQLLGEKNGRIYEKYIKPIICSAAHFQILSPEHAWQNKILQLLRQIFTLQTNEADCELSTVFLLLEIWKILFDHLPSQAEAHLNNGETLRNSQLTIMMQFIHEHYCEPISLKEISSAAFLSKNTALQRFRNGIRLSPVLYMIRYRLTRAAELLLTTESSVTHIAEQVGFESAGYFAENLKNVTKYRRRNTEVKKAKNNNALQKVKRGITPRPI